LPYQSLQESGFAGAIATNQGDLFTGIDNDACIVKQEFCAKVNR
jgi:hypothetical protein